MSDRELLELIEKEPDGLITAERIEQKSSLTKKEAKKRLYYLYMQGLLHPFHTSSLKAQYSLKEKATRLEPPVLSNQPWLTVEDMINLFKLHDYKLSTHRICMSTGLPVSVIVRELKYFVFMLLQNFK